MLPSRFAQTDADYTCPPERRFSCPPGDVLGATPGGGRPDVPQCQNVTMGVLQFRDRLSEDVRWWVDFGMVILAILVIVGLLVVGWHTWVPDQVQLHA